MMGARTSSSITARSAARGTRASPRGRRWSTRSRTVRRARRHGRSASSRSDLGRAHGCSAVRPIEHRGDSAVAVFCLPSASSMAGSLVLRIRTSRGMTELSDREAGELRERLRRVASAQPAEETIAVSANASTSVTFTHTQTVAVVDVLAQWMNELGGEEIGEGLFKLMDALTNDLERE